jgi:hypothetical protein
MDRANLSALSASLWGMTAMAVVFRFPGIVITFLVLYCVLNLKNSSRPMISLVFVFSYAQQEGASGMIKFLLKELVNKGS